MEIVRDDDRNRGPESVPNTAHDLFVGLRVSIGDHRAMKRKQNAVELRRGLQAGDQALRQSLEVSFVSGPFGVAEARYAG